MSKIDEPLRIQVTQAISSNSSKPQVDTWTENEAKDLEQNGAKSQKIWSHSISSPSDKRLVSRRRRSYL